MSGDLRIGTGFDAHPFAAGRPLLLGGVVVPHGRGLGGHSDADVLLHAISDAILGALGKGDLGRHFPDSDPRLAGIESSVILRDVARMMTGDGWRVVNVDSVIIAQEPRIAPFAEAMQKSIGLLLDIPPACVGVKAKTTEYMGFTGRGEGIAALAVALLTKQGKGI